MKTGFLTFTLIIISQLAHATGLPFKEYYCAHPTPSWREPCEEPLETLKCAPGEVRGSAPTYQVGEDGYVVSTTLEHYCTLPGADQARIAAMCGPHEVRALGLASVPQPDGSYRYVVQDKCMPKTEWFTHRCEAHQGQVAFNAGLMSVPEGVRISRVMGSYQAGRVWDPNPRTCTFACSQQQQQCQRGDGTRCEDAVIQQQCQQCGQQGQIFQQEIRSYDRILTQITFQSMSEAKGFLIDLYCGMP
jgi:hypothetical protein